MPIQGTCARRSAAALIFVALAASGCDGSDSGPSWDRNQRPAAGDVVDSVAHRGEARLHPLWRASDPDGDALRVVAIGTPGHGHASLDGDVVRYVAPAGFEGEDALTYTVSDPGGLTATGTIRITVLPNHAPLAIGRYAWAVEDRPVDVLLEGSDFEDLPAELTVELVTSPAHGILQLATATSAPRLATYTPAPDWSGEDAFWFRVVDRDGAASMPARVQLSVSPANDAPVATPVARLLTDEDVAVEVTLTGTDVDLAWYEHLAVGIAQSPAHGKVYFANLYNPVPAVARYVPDPDFAGTDAFTFYVYDGQVSSAPVTVRITVNPVNDPPVATTPGTVLGKEDGPVQLSLSGHDAESSPSALRVELVTLPSHGTLSATSGAAPLAAVYTPAPDWSGIDRFAYRVVDPDGAYSDPAEVTLSIAAVDDPPFATTVAPVATDEDVPATITLTGTDPDDAVSALVVLVTPPAHGTLSAASGVAPFDVTWTPPANWSGSDVLSFVVRDPSGALSSRVQVTLTVNAVNDAPVARPDRATVCPGVAARIAVLPNDADPDADPLAVVSVTQGLLGSAAIDGGEVLYTALPGVTGTDAFTYTVSDGRLSATATVAVTVEGPALLSQLPASGTTGHPLQIWGRCLGAAQGTVTIGGRPAEVTTWTPRYVVATVPTGYEPGVHDLIVTPSGGAPLLGAYEIVPWIALVEPWQVAPGEAQAIVGDGFVTPAGTVAYGTTVAALDGWTATAVQGRMPAAGRWSLSLTTSTGVASNVYPVASAGPDTWWTERVPGGRSGHTAVWTGTEMIVHGGARAGAALADGGRYDPRHDSWIPISSAAVSGGIKAHSAVWTGSEMIVWGGIAGNAYVATGARYRPGADEWAATSTAGAPAGRSQHTAVWTGSRMIVWGGQSGWGYRADGGSYDPATDQWTALATTGAPTARYAHAAVWTGKELIVWGGFGLDAGYTGARYDPAADRWTAMSTQGAPQPRAYAAAVWTGDELVVWGGYGTASGQLLADGARYDPATDRWRPIATAGAPAPRLSPLAIWTGRDVVVWGGQDATALASGGRYDPVADAWAPVDAAAAPAAGSGASAVWTGAELIVWGGGTWSDRGGRYDPARDRWLPTRSGTPGEPAPRRDHAWACLPGGDLVVWGGNVPGAGDDGTGARYHAATGTWTPLAASGAPSAREGATAVWTGTHLVVWGGKRVAANGATAYLGDGARYDPAADAWIAMAATAAPAGRSGHTATWSGGRMIVFGGRSATGVLATGAAYDPATDTWDALPTMGAPTARQLHTAVDAGGEVLIFGGESATGGALATGASFHVADWIWTALPAGPAARERHTAVWTGEEMLVVGGTLSATSTYPIAAGGRYVPRLGAWGSLDAPVPFYGHGAVWTGTQLVAWGGSSAAGPYLYAPATRAWTSGAAPSTAPPVRDRPSLCWTGTDVVIWGGAAGGQGVGALGRYRP